MALIGISGKKGSGKDTVGKIIQIITDNPHFTDEAVERFVSRETYSQYSKFDIKKFADKLKLIVSTLIGCSLSDLEDPEFKEKELSEDWWCYKKSLFDQGILYPYNSPSKIADDVSYYIIKHTPRTLLQIIGTEAGRNLIHPNIWVNSLMQNYKPLHKGEIATVGDYFIAECRICKESFNGDKRQTMCDKCILDDNVKIFPNWVITDVRFPNEAKAIKDKDSILIQVLRDTGNKEDLHPSETALDDYHKWNHIILNKGTILDLVKMVREILVEEKLTEDKRERKF